MLLNSPFEWMSYPSFAAYASARYAEEEARKEYYKWLAKQRRQEAREQRLWEEAHR